MEEGIGELGYINEDMQHVLINIRDPALVNPQYASGRSVQVALTIETATILSAKLSEFLDQHRRTYN